MLFPLSALLLPVLGLQTSPTSSATAIYHDNVAKFALTYPSKFLPQPNTALEAAMRQEGEFLRAQTGKVPMEIGCSHLDMVAVGGQGQEYGMVQIIRVNEACMGGPPDQKELEDMASNALTGILGKMSNFKLEPSYQISISEHNAVAQFGAAILDPAQSQKVKAASECFEAQGNTVCILEVAMGESQLRELLKNTIQFDGKQPTVLLETLPPPDLQR